MTQAIFGLVGVVLGVLLTHAVQVRADRMSWSRRTRQQLYAAAVRTMQAIEQAIREYELQLSTAAWLVNLRRESHGRSDAKLEELAQELREEHGHAAKAVRDEIRVAERLAPEFQMVASRSMHRLFRFFLVTATTVVHLPAGESLEDDHAVVQEHRSDVSSQIERFIDRARTEFRVPDYESMTFRGRVRRSLRGRWRRLRNRLLRSS